MQRREARIARDAAKKLKDLEKSARLLERLPKGGVRLGEAVPANKSVRAGADPVSVFSMQMTWTCDNPDCKDEWSWGIKRQWSSEVWADLIHPKLSQWEKLTWGEIDRPSSDTGHKMHHNMDTAQICDEAQSRMMEIERYADVIFRFRLGNKRRLWGHRIVNNFEVLWFDPTHQIYPTDPD